MGLIETCSTSLYKNEIWYKIFNPRIEISHFNSQDVYHILHTVGEEANYVGGRGWSKNYTSDYEIPNTISSNTFNQPASASVSSEFSAKSGVTPASKNRFNILSCFSWSSCFCFIPSSRIAGIEVINKQSLDFVNVVVLEFKIL